MDGQKSTQGDYPVMSTFSVVIFACESREHLLRETWESFRPLLSKLPHQIILALDGQISPQIINLIEPCILVQNHHRRGYVASIRNALALIDSEFFLWLEEDWRAIQQLDVAAAISMLRAHPSWVQVRWSKVAQLSAEDLVLVPGMRFSSVGFSMNPSVCRTALVRAAFEAIEQETRDADSSHGRLHEIEFTKWFQKNSQVCAVMETNGVAPVRHMGYLESTGREWHMMASLQRHPTEHYLSLSTIPSIGSRLRMVAKLILSLVDLAIRQCRDNGAYELANRIVVTLRGYIKERKSLTQKQ